MRESWMVSRAIWNIVTLNKPYIQAHTQTAMVIGCHNSITYSPVSPFIAPNKLLQQQSEYFINIVRCFSLALLLGSVYSKQGNNVEISRVNDECHVKNRRFEICCRATPKYGCYIFSLYSPSANTVRALWHTHSDSLICVILWGTH